jgi:hypothetical protein
MINVMQPPRVQEIDANTVCQITGTDIAGSINNILLTACAQFEL